MGKQSVRECSTCGRTMSIQAYGRCGGCNYWHKKGLSDDQIREKMGKQPTQAEVRGTSPKPAPHPKPRLDLNLPPRPHELQLRLDMSDHPDVLRGVSERARTQFRPVEMQILYELSRNGICAAEE